MGEDAAAVGEPSGGAVGEAGSGAGDGVSEGETGAASAPRPIQIVASYLEPHNRHEVISGDTLPYGQAQAYLARRLRLAFRPACPVSGAYEWQRGDSFCQGWCHWYAHLRMGGATHGQACARMHREQLGGLERFMRYCYAEVHVTLKRITLTHKYT